MLSSANALLAAMFINGSGFTKYNTGVSDCTTCLQKFLCLTSLCNCCNSCAARGICGASIGNGSTGTTGTINGFAPSIISLCVSCCKKSLCLLICCILCVKLFKYATM